MILRSNARLIEMYFHELSQILRTYRYTLKDMSYILTPSPGSFRFSFEYRTINTIPAFEITIQDFTNVRLIQLPENKNTFILPNGTYFEDEVLYGRYDRYHILYQVRDQYEVFAVLHQLGFAFDQICAFIIECRLCYSEKRNADTLNFLNSIRDSLPRSPLDPRYST